MKDVFGRKIRKGDLVYTKATGRYSRGSAGIATGNGRVRFEGGTYGGASQQVLLENDPTLKDLKEKLVASIEAEDAKNAAEKEARETKRIKKFKRFGVYTRTKYDLEMYIGDCEIDGDLLNDVWLTVSPAKRDQEAGGENLKLSVSYYFYRSHKAPIIKLRQVKKPLKIKELFVLTKEQFDSLEHSERITVI